MSEKSPLHYRVKLYIVLGLNVKSRLTKTWRKKGIRTEILVRRCFSSMSAVSIIDSKVFNLSSLQTRCWSKSPWPIGAELSLKNMNRDDDSSGMWFILQPNKLFRAYCFFLWYFLTNQLDFYIKMRLMVNNFLKNLKKHLFYCSFVGSC